MTALPPPHVKLERVKLCCALGLRFRDTATKQIVRSGLRVNTRPVGALPNARAVSAQPNPSGVWLFYGLPGLRAFELGTEDFPELGSPAQPLRFQVEVEDEEGRFLPCRFVATTAEKGPVEFAPQFSSPPERGDVPLFSAPSRPVPPACAVIRTRLVAPTVGKPDAPARWALLRAVTTVRGRPFEVFGLAEKNGNVALMFPWPELVKLPNVTSPPGGLHADTQGWDFEFAAWHDSNCGEAAFANLDGLFLLLAGSPDDLWTSVSPPEEFRRATLRYGRELFLPEDLISPPTTVEHTLIITPAA